MKKRRKILALFLLLGLALSLCACGASSKGGVATEDAKYQNSMAMDALAPEPEVFEEEQAEAGADSGAGLAPSATAEAVAAEGARVDPEKIIYSADVTVETTAFEEAVKAVSKLVEEYGGWIESSSVNSADYYNLSRGYSSSRSACYTLRIPSERFDELMGNLSTLGNVPYTHTYTENVTAQYYDAQARLTAYTAQETRLLEMMEQAETVADTIAIEEKLTELRYQIESLQSTLNNYDRRVNYSSVCLELEEVQEYTPEAEQRTGFGGQLVQALQRGGKNFLTACRELILGLASALPLLLLLTAILFATGYVLRKRREKRRARKAASEAGAEMASQEPDKKP